MTPALHLPTGRIIPIPCSMTCLPVPDLSRISSILNVLGLPSAAFVSAPMQVDINYVLIVGADYQPCFNPATIAP